MDWNAIAQWRIELRSGKHDQGYGQLRYGNQYCCLGVFMEKVACLKPTPTQGSGYFYDEGATSGLSKPTAEKFGFSETLPKIFGLSFHLMNDHGAYMDTEGQIQFPTFSHTSRFTFDEIADLLDIAILMHEDGVPDSEIFT
jgi:hypothetical protein